MNYNLGKYYFGVDSKVDKKVNPNMLLQDVAYKEIKKSIIQEKYKPGTLLSERELINELDMSKTPIKSAIVRLESEGFVTVSSKQGIIINDLSVDRINDIYNLRIALESYNCDQLTKNISQAQTDKLETNLNEMKVIVEDLNVIRFAELDHDFHIMITRFTGNKEIYRVLLNYYDHLFRITLKHLNKEPERMIKFYEDHIIILDKIKNNDGAGLVMKRHLEESKMMLFQ